MKKIKVLISSVSFLTPVAVLAQFSTPGGTNLPSGSIFGIITNIMNWLLGLVGVFGVIGFAIAGILYLTAAGSESQIDKAKTAMMWSIVGVVVALIGLVILKAAESLLGGTSSTF